jgi:hypothetical protein
MEEKNEEANSNCIDYWIIRVLHLCPDDWTKGPDDGRQGNDGSGPDDEQYDGDDQSNVRNDGKNVKYDERHASGKHEADV